MSEGNRISKAYDRERRRAQGEDVPPADLDELVKAKLDGFARRQQFEGEIKGRYGYLSTPAAEMVVKIKAEWWETPDGIAVRDLLRESGGEPADLTKIAKGHSEARAAIGRLDVV